MQALWNLALVAMVEAMYLAYPLLAAGILTFCIWALLKARRRQTTIVFAVATPLMFVLFLAVGAILYAKV